MTSGDLLDLFRDEMNDSAVPYLWSDDFVFGAIDDAQTTFCRLTDGISDGSTVAVTQIAIVPATEWYAFNPVILKVRTSYRTDTGRPVDIISQEDMVTRGYRWDGSTGTLKALVMGIETGKVRAYPMPTETVTVQLTVFRKPLITITDDQALEIPADHHRALLFWAKYRAYMKQDAECFDKTRAADNKADFEAYCKEAKLEQRRARRQPGAVVYGGIVNAIGGMSNDYGYPR
jgi:hypothetical protein